MKRKAIGLVTVLYQSNTVLPGFIKSLSQQTCNNYYLYIIDNSPSTETDTLLNNLFNTYSNIPYTIIKCTSNLGIAKGNNIGIKEAISNGAEYILLLNNDIEFYQEELLEHLLKVAVREDEMFVVPKILYFNTRKIWMAGGKFNLIRSRTTHLGEKEEDSLKYNITKHVEYAPTCFILIHKSVFEDIGYMDEKYFVYYDDTDFLYRAKKKGYSILYLPESEVFHKVSISTGGQNSLFTIYYANRNRLYFIKKNFSIIIATLSYTCFFFAFLYKIFFYSQTQRKALFKAFYDGIRM